jgi:hypothetical protein
MRGGKSCTWSIYWAHHEAREMTGSHEIRYSLAVSNLEPELLFVPNHRQPYFI